MFEYTLAGDAEKILLVEDNTGDARLVKIFLMEAGMQEWGVTIKPTLAEAMAQLRVERFSAVLLDLSLPDSRGFETLEKITKEFPDLNLIVLTGLDDKRLGLRAVKAGAQDFLVKGQFDAELLAKALRYSVERSRVTKSLEEAQRIAHIGNWEYDVQRQSFRASDETYRIVGLPLPGSGSQPTNLSEWIGPDGWALCIDIFKKVQKNGTLKTDIQFVWPDRSTRHAFVLCNAIYDQDGGNMRRIVGIVQDITDRKSAEEEMRKSQQLYQVIFSQSKDAIYISSTEGQMVDFNEAAVLLFGYEPDELRQINTRALYNNPTDRDRLSEIITARSFVRDFKVEIKRKNGEIRHCLITSTSIRTDNFTGYHGLVRDVTEKLQAEELRKAKELAERTAQMKERFLANVSHEIRTPMNAILGMSHLLLKTSLDPEAFSYADTIRQASENLLKIINDILEVSQLQSGKVAFEQKEFLLSETVNNVVKILQFKAREKDLDLTLNIKGSIPERLMGDKTRLSQIIMNLVTNAIKFTDKGYVRISIDKESEDENQVGIALRVSDSGVGIPSEKLQTIFETFVQVSEDMAKNQGGTGLGLAIVRQLAEMQGGSVAVESHMGHGSTFLVRLPFLKCGTHTAPSLEEKKAIAEPPMEGVIRILLAEDHKMNQIVAKKILESEWKNLNVVIAENGREAVEKLREQHFDLILMDIQMPEMDGYEATRMIRMELPAPKSNVPILAMTAHAFISLDEKYKEYGMDDFVLKPFDPQQLFEKIAQHLSPKPTNTSFPLMTAQIDLSYMDLMSDGDPEIKQTMLGMLLEEPLSEIAQMKALAAQQNWKLLMPVSHKMKSTLAFVGCKQLTDLNKEVERRCMSLDEAELVPGLLDQVEVLYRQVLPQLKAEYAKLSAENG